VAGNCLGTAFLRALDATNSSGCARLAEEFLAEKEFTVAGGLELSDAICVSIAAQGCLPILELGLDYYRGWVGIVVYPTSSSFRAASRTNSASSMNTRNWPRAKPGMAGRC
jgi:Mlc titration factor MtfA (ptsG expression regulator)